MCKCTYSIILFAAAVLLVGLVLYMLVLSTVSPLIKYSDVEKCPFCYGKTICDNFGNISLKKTIFASFVNTFNMKNVFYAGLNGVDLVIKKLGSNVQLKHLDDKICRQHNASRDCDLSKLNGKTDYKQKVWKFLTNRVTLLQSFKVCSESTAQTVLKRVLSFKQSDVTESEFLKNIWTVLEVNVEPIILQLLDTGDSWPAPIYYGSCGRFIVEENCGMPLTYKANLDWFDRAFLALQLLQAAKNFTSNHPDFRFYLTDLSSDNIVVDDSLKLTIVDFENVVVAQKNMSAQSTLHHSEDFQEDGFAYSEEELCNSSLSDHNYYAVCKVLLSKKAQWPMMKNGLLHSPPETVLHEHKELFDLIEECVAPSVGPDRFVISEKIVSVLNYVLVNQRLKKQTISSNRTKTKSKNVDL